MGVEGQDPADKCTLCSIRRDEHTKLRHPFGEQGVDPGAAIVQPSKKDKDKQQRPQLVIAPAPDLVLRQVLLDKGLLRPAELEAKERELTLGIKPESQAPGVFPLTPPDS
jgi:hypothetical protein